MKQLITIFVLALVSIACYFTVICSVPEGPAPQSQSALLSITATSTCPVAGCTAASCHAAATPPTPDGSFDMACPDTGCTSSECHSWNALSGHYHNPNNASLDAWILFPALLTIALIAFVKRAGKGGDSR